MLVATRGYDVVELENERFRKNDQPILEYDADPLMTKEWIKILKKYLSM